MILHPTVIANLLASYVGSFMVVYAAYYGAQIIRHWNILARISRINHRLLNKPYMKTSAGLEMLRANKQYVKLISEDDQQQRA